MRAPDKSGIIKGLSWQPPWAPATSGIHLVTMGSALAVGKFPSTSTDGFVWAFVWLSGAGINKGPCASAVRKGGKEEDAEV